MNYINFKNSLILNNEFKIDLVSRNSSLNYLPNLFKDSGDTSKKYN